MLTFESPADQSITEELRAVLPDRSNSKTHSNLDAWQTSYVCVDNVRFWSMLAVIAVHSLVAWDIPSTETSTQNLQLALLQVMKFGTIGFYFISGFLLGHRLDDDAPRAYYQRRLKKVGAP